MLTALDRQQITETIARLSFVADEDQFDHLGEVFTPDATYDMTSSGMGAFQGIETLRTAMGELAASGHAPLSHVTTNTVITETNDESASVRSKALMIMQDGSVHGAVYDDTVTLNEGRWLIAGRVILPIRAAAGNEHATGEH
jgi:ketosteroid isomerase-like protein